MKNVKEFTRKLRILFDFDGVIHSYKSGWHGVDLALDSPVEGIRECINEMKNDGNYEIVIYSSRCGHEKGIKCIEEYCKNHKIYYDEISKDKKAAFLTIDDRCICFDGNAYTLFEKIKQFKPWTKKGKKEFDNPIRFDTERFNNLGECIEFLKKYKKENYNKYNGLNILSDYELCNILQYLEAFLKE